MKPHRLAYDVVVVGGGHAGIEASLAAARMGCSTALVTMDVRAIGRMSCNPAIGGTAKGHLVREIDALGGEMGKIADATGIHFRMLNRSKGPAIWSPRCQNDRDWYNGYARATVESQSGLDIVVDTIQDLEINDGGITGVATGMGRKIRCLTLVVCTGTFLNAVMYTGTSQTVGGRFGERSSTGLSERLTRAGFRTGRLKTGTPPRLKRNSIDFDSTETQPADADPVPFSHQNRRITNHQIPMYLTYTNAATHDVLRLGFDESPMFTGRIKGIGPRYCPSIEDKIHRFADKERHQIFLEPEGYESDVVYVNGFSTSLPEQIQRKALTTIPGLEQSVMLRPGYAVEYDFFPPHQLEHTLESKIIKRLFFAGQINGTSGYEEAAGQGLIAGINAALQAQCKDPLVLQRSESYIGVMIDDLINKGTEEPYRIFTSRAEYRLLLRQDNADSRLMRSGYGVGLVSSDAIRKLNEKEQKIEEAKREFSTQTVSPTHVNELLCSLGSPTISESETLAKLLRRPEVSITKLVDHEPACINGALRNLVEEREIRERVEIEIKYDGYLKRQEDQVKRLKRSESITIPFDFDFARVKSLSSEGKERLQQIKPRSLGQAARISGVTPADISVLIVSLKT